jgi:tRNA threonylcarbamoyladenosine biosynthesis protein TsaE
MTQATGTKVHEFETNTAADTIRVGHEIAKLLTPPKFLILKGDLGAGKTTLVKGIAEALDAAEPDEVTSPTFTLIHLDLYRIEQERQLDSLGLDEIATPDSIVLVEWGDKFPSVAKRSNGEIVMKTTGGDSRKITLTLKD